MPLPWPSEMPLPWWPLGTMVGWSPWSSSWNVCRRNCLTILILPVQCQVAPKIPHFLLFLFMSRNAAFVLFAMLKHKSFQSRLYPWVGLGYIRLGYHWVRLGMDKKPGLETISWLVNAAKEGSCVNVLQLCVVRTTSTNQLHCKNCANQSAVRKHLSGGLIWWKS